MASPSFLTPEQFEAHCNGLYPGKRSFSPEEVAAIAGLTAKTIANASSAKDLVGVGFKRHRRYEIWEIYKWECARRVKRAPGGKGKKLKAVRAFHRRTRRVPQD